MRKKRGQERVRLSRISDLYIFEKKEICHSQKAGGHIFFCCFVLKKTLLKFCLFYKMPVVISKKRSIIREYEKEAQRWTK